MSLREIAARGAAANEIEDLRREVERLRALVSQDLGILERERIFADRLARLHSFTASITEASTLEDIARALVERGRAALGARAVAIWLRAPDGSGRLERQVGFSARFAPDFAAVRADPSTPVGAALLSGANSWIPSRGQLTAKWPAARCEEWLEGEFALATLPLQTHSGRIGAIAAAFAGSRPFVTEERAMLVAISRQGAQALERAQLLEAERRARADAEAEHERTSFLYESSALLSASLEWEDTLSLVARLAVPRVADWCAVFLADDVEQRRGAAAVAHADRARAEQAKALTRRFPPDPQAPRGPARVVREGVPELYEEIAEEDLGRLACDEDHLRWLREIAPRSAMIVPMEMRGRTLGALILVSAESGRRYGPSDLAMAESLARRCALAIESARLYGEAQRAVRARDEVLAIVSHDLRNPLHAIVMASHLLQNPSTPPERIRHHAAAIERSARRAGRLIRDLLDLSTLESGKVMLDRAPVDVASLLADAAAFIQPLAAERSISVEVAPGAPASLDAWCDRERIIQVFSNLLGNAVNFTPPGGRVVLGAVPGDSEVRFSVSDTGPGVPIEHQAHIFDRYWKTRESRQGAGLGLSIARSIVNAHGGHIWVESAPGEGATFVFTVPRPSQAR